MTLSTDVYLTGTILPKELFNLAIQAVTAADGRPFDTDNVKMEEYFKWDSDTLGYAREDNCIMASTGQGLPAWTILSWDPDGRTPEYVEPALDSEDQGHIVPEYDYYLDFDTAYGYRGNVGGCSNLHAVTIAVLSHILPDTISISAWRNEFTNELFYDTAPENLMNFAQITDISPQQWHDTYVQPALDLLAPQN